MSLPYPDLDSVKTTQVSLNDINSVSRKLIENDQSMLLDLQNIPIIWECKWYNDQEIDGYPFGTKVWLNTEDPKEFVANKFDDITNYILNSEMAQTYEVLSSDTGSLNRFLLSVVQNPIGTHRTPLYYLGDLTKRVEVMLLTATGDNGITAGYCKEPPSNTKYWKKVLELSTVSDYSKWMDEMLVSCYGVNLSNHVDEYHLTSMTPQQISTEYLLSNFSNLDTYQRIATHGKRLRKKRIDAFDCVHKFVMNRTSSTGPQYQWFRLWKSGYLEHGGIVKYKTSGDGGQQIVLTSWTYDGGKIPPKFDYQLGFQPMYATGMDLKLQNGAQYEPSNIAYGPEYTYNLVVGEIDGSGNSWSTNGGSRVYDIQSDGFKVDMKNSSTRYISYYASGFLTQNTMRKYS